jgi:hypothetical protein
MYADIAFAIRHFFIKKGHSVIPGALFMKKNNVYLSIIILPCPKISFEFRMQT